MAIADELLTEAGACLKVGSSQAVVRRSMSTSYYALFHLLVQDAAGRWAGGYQERSVLERAFNHGSMKNVSKLFAGKVWTDSFDVRFDVPHELRSVATAFGKLQERRHLADYDNQRYWSILQARETLQTSEQAFRSWHTIRTDRFAGSYLLAMLLGRAR
jgi:hypothetical protein